DLPDADAALVDDLALVIKGKADAWDPQFGHGSLQEAAEFFYSRRIEPVGRTAGERLPRIAGGTQTLENQIEGRAAPFRHGLGDVDQDHGPCRSAAPRARLNDRKLIRRGLVLDHHGLVPSAACRTRRHQMHRTIKAGAKPFPGLTNRVGAVSRLVDVD